MDGWTAFDELQLNEALSRKARAQQKQVDAMQELMDKSNQYFDQFSGSGMLAFLVENKVEIMRLMGWKGET